MSQPQVFISYQRADEVFARQVREHLTAYGVTTWMDQYDIPVGAYWPDEIDKGLAAADIVVGVLSPDAVESRNVKNEWDWAIQNDKRLLLLQYRPCVIPHRYISINFIDATSESTGAFGALLATIGIPTLPQELDTLTGAVISPTAIRHRQRSLTRSYPVEPPLVGREHEQEQLADATRALLVGRGSLVLIGGEAGIGKTAMTSWLGWRAEEEGAVVLSGGCYDLSMTPPYGPWIEIIRAWPEGGGLPPVPEDLRGGNALSLLPSQQALFEIVADFLVAAGATRPLVLVLEDLHWADQASLDLLRYVARQVAESRIVVIGAYRSDELHRRHPLTQMLPLLDRETGAIRIELGRLADTAIERLVRDRYQLL
ncbi:MAG: AAA family ATPase, partial [Thermomicrobiales bacterium]